MIIQSNSVIQYRISLKLNNAGYGIVIRSARAQKFVKTTQMSKLTVIFKT